MLAKGVGLVAAGLTGIAVATLGIPGHGAASASAAGRGGGRSPVVRVVDPDLDAVWCSGPRQCLGVGADGQNRAVSAIWNGRSWRFVKTPHRGIGLADLSCSGWTECLALSGSLSGMVDEWNGVSWKALPALRSAFLDSVACAARHRCVAIGFDATFAWNGKAWSRRPLPKQIPAGSEFPAAACAGPADCMAIGSHDGPGPVAMRWNGLKWHRVAAGPTCVLQGQCGLSADGRGRYVAVGDNTSFFWNGRSRRRVALPVVNDEWPGISCTGSFCLAAGSSSEAAWNGRSWRTLPATGFGNAAVSCTKSTACMDVGSHAASSWNGRRWTLLRLSVTDELSALSCTRPGNCIATGTTNDPALVHDWLAERWNGSRWQVIPGPAQTVGTGQEQISCTSTQFCMALNTLAFDPGAQRWNGRQWIATNLPAQSAAGSNGIEGLSCGSSSSCVAVAGDVAWTWDGTSWKATNPQTSGEHIDLQSVSCASAAMCMAIGYEFGSSCDEGCTFSGLAEQWNGSSWTVSDNPVLGPGTLDNVPGSQISCPAATFCMETTRGPHGLSVRSWKGHAWTQQTVPFSDAAAISCGGTSSCAVITTFVQDGQLDSTTEIWNGTSWRPASPEPGGLLSALSCSRPQRCTAAGATAEDLTQAQSWNGTAWKQLRPVNP